MGIDLLPHVEKNEERPWLSEKWTGRHTLVVLMHISGSTHREIEAATGYSYGRVSQIINDERAQIIVAQNLHRMQEAAADVTIRMKLLAHEALDEIVDEMRTSPNSKVRQKAAFGILDRAGYSPVRKTEISTPNSAGPKELSEVFDRMEGALDDLRNGKEIVYEEGSPGETLKPTPEPPEPPND